MGLSALAPLARHSVGALGRRIAVGLGRSMKFL